MATTCPNWVAAPSISPSAKEHSRRGEPYRMLIVPSPALAAAYPGFFVPHHDIGSFLGTLNDIIHPEVRKLYPGADVPTFGFTTASDGTITMRYGSPRRLCAFAEGLIEGAATQFGQVVTIEQPRCMLRGDELCTIEIRVDH